MMSQPAQAFGQWTENTPKIRQSRILIRKLTLIAIAQTPWPVRLGKFWKAGRANSSERRRRAAHSLEVLQGETELGQQFLMRNGLVVLQPLASLGNSALFLRADLFILDRSVSDHPGQGTENSLQQ